ncbi:MAG: dihydroorotate dehydrogenase-like protein [Myxococcales bacterium]|nr:dihydroorotate dehydrogenase-like protein [Myxococcales bacterium]
MDLSTTYLGLHLTNPLIVGASPLCDDLDAVRRLEDAGAAAIVMHSLFEEQISRERERNAADLEAHVNAFAEASSFLPHPNEFHLGPEAYLEQIRRLRAAVSMPVIGSLNGVTSTGWLDYARMMEQAGAHALELNTYYIASDPTEDAVAVERRTLDIVRAVKAAVAIPITVKLSPFFSALSHFAAELEAAGADGLVLFNRFYQPDIDIVELEVRPDHHLSDPTELLLRLRWLAILSGQRPKLQLAASGGVHGALDVVKAVMTGAHSVQMISAVLRHGPGHLTRVRDELARTIEQLGYSTLAEMRGCMNLARCPDTSAFERGNYLRVLHSWRDPHVHDTRS